MNFEQLGILFTANTHSRGLCRLDIDEAMYMYRVIKLLLRKKNSYERLRVCEIGTYKGGTTCLLACAGAWIDTIDNYSSKTFDNYKHNPADDVKCLLEDHKVLDRCQVWVKDTRKMNNESLHEYYDLLFIDGDHSYEGVKADYNNWIHTLKVGGQLIFHDSCIAREGATGCEGVMKFVEELPHKKFYEYASLTHFIKKAK